MTAWLGSIWKYVSGGALALAGILGAALLIVANQRDRAREAAQVAKAQAKSTDAAREAEHRIGQSRADARAKSAETQREHEDRSSDQRPDGDFRH